MTIESIFQHSLRLPIIALLVLLVAACQQYGDNNPPGAHYESVQIGKDTWMVKNLDVVTYRNGDPIKQMGEVKEWLSANSGGWCVYNNDTSHLEDLGRIYNWHAVNDPRNIAPEGWHVATNSEWQALINTLGGVDSAGAKLKEVGFTHWAPPNTGATNSTGFSAYAGGYRSEADGTFKDIGGFGFWWLNSSSTAGYAYTMHLSTITEKAYSGENLKNFGAYVRCVKD